MPSIKASMNVDGHSLPDAERPSARAVAPPQSPTSTLSTLFDSSLPGIASGSDQYSRQFYAGGRLPQRRFFPVSPRT